MTTRLSVNISLDTEARLRRLAEAENVTFTEALRRLVGYGIVVYEADRDGCDVLIRRDHRTERVVLVA